MPEQPLQDVKLGCCQCPKKVLGRGGGGVFKGKGGSEKSLSICLSVHIFKL